jgi:D-alanyl-D-alanine carboxypeptidase
MRKLLMNLNQISKKEATLMKLRYLIMALVTTAIVVSCQQNRKANMPINEALQAAMDESIKNSGAIGVSAAIIFPDGQMWKGASGISHEGVPVTTDMLFDIGSIEKNFQAALALKLVEEGLIALDDPLEKWFPPYPNISGKITIRQILNLTSGIDNLVEDPNSPFRVGYVNIQHEKIWTWEDIYQEFVGESNFEPGTRCAYSSTNYIVLKHVVEKATKEKQEKVFEDRLLKSYHLNHTLADFSKPIPENMPIIHGWFDTNDDGKPDDISEYSINWITSLSPMCVYSTPSDLAQWIDALYHKKSVLSEEMLKAMLTFNSPVQNEPMMNGYGLGVANINLGAILPNWENVKVYGHLGSAFGYTSFAGYFPDLGISVTIMFNRGCDAGTNKAVGIVSGAFLDVLFRYLGVKESKQQDSVSGMMKELEKSPNDVHLMYRIARQQQADKDDYEAWLIYEKILKQDPDDKFGYKTQALFWKASYDGVIGKKPENLIAFIAEHQDYKDIQDAYNWLAKTYLRRKEINQAVQVYHDALKVFNTDAEFYNYYAWWVYENKVADEYETAIKYIEEAVSLKPDAYYIWDTLAWLYFVNGEQQKAVEASTKALSLAPEKQYDAYEKALNQIQKGK